MRFHRFVIMILMNRRQLLFGILLFGATIWMICIYTNFTTEPYFHPLTLIPCQPSVLDPFDPTLKHISTPPPPVVHCDKVELQIVYEEDGNLFINHTELATAKLTRSQVKCAYRYMIYTDSNDYRTTEAILIVRDETAIEGDYVNVQCRQGNRLLQDSIHAVVYMKDKPEPMKNSVEKPSVLIIGLDSLSRSNFERLFKKTHKYLMTEMNAVDFKLHTKIYDNTFVNVMALLSCKVPNDIPFYRRGWMDTWTNYIWERFHEHGYISMFTEDFVVNRMFHTWYPQVNFVGFSKQPTHFYDYAYWKYAEDNKMTQYYSENGDAADIKYSMSCTGTKATFQVHMDYLKRFHKSYTGQRTFSFFWSSDNTHDSLEYGHVLDSNLTQLLHDLRPTLKNTITVVMSDHGFRWGAFRQTKLGRQESRNPMLFVALSEDLQKARPDWMSNLKDNSERMTTVYDLHRMMQKIVEDTPDEDVKNRMAKHRDIIQRSQGKMELTTRGKSLLHTSITSPRSCASLGIPMEYCPCVDDRPSITNATVLSAIGNAVVAEINWRLERKAAGLCATNTIANISSDVEVTPVGVEDDGLHGDTVYTVRLTMQPNSALIETNVLMTADGKVEVTSETFERLDRYGTTSHCVSGDLRTICYCKIQLKT